MGSGGSGRAEALEAPGSSSGRGGPAGVRAGEKVG